MARELVGASLVADRGGDLEVRAVVVEVEAYLGGDDPASHAHRGPTPRAAIMFSEPARLYVYLSYGLHHCANVICEPVGRAGAVLLRAAAVTAGEETVRTRRTDTPHRGGDPASRGVRSHASAARAAHAEAEMAGPAGPTPATRQLASRDLLRGPGNLCRGLHLSLADNGLDLMALEARLQVVAPATMVPLAAGPRIGISTATDRVLRFAWAGHPAVSRGGTLGPVPPVPPG